jgi:thioredoxin-dependent peroxiredoxin
MLRVGDKAPDFAAATQDGSTFRLAEQRGKWVALYFFPKAFTPG